MKLGSRHLTYCSNIHAGETWSSVRDTLGEVLPALELFDEGGEHQSSRKLRRTCRPSLVSTDSG